MLIPVLSINYWDRKFRDDFLSDEFARSIALSIVDLISIVHTDPITILNQNKVILMKTKLDRLVEDGKLNRYEKDRSIRYELKHSEVQSDSLCIDDKKPYSLFSVCEGAVDYYYSQTSTANAAFDTTRALIRDIVGEIEEEIK